jgi:antagonist of KipI
MGYRLQGPQLTLQQPINIISSAVTKGTIQLLPNGQLIILMADHQTTGGYPVVGHVPSAFVNALAQCRPTQTIQFALTDISSAEAALASRHLHLLQLQNACTFRIKPFLTNANGRS